MQSFAKLADSIFFQVPKCVATFVDTRLRLIAARHQREPPQAHMPRALALKSQQSNFVTVGFLAWLPTGTRFL